MAGSLTYETATDLYPEPADKIHKYTKAVLVFTGYWRESDPYTAIMDFLRGEIQALRQDLAAMNERVNALSLRVAQLENDIRMERLRDYAGRIESLAFRISQQPADAGTRASIAFDAGALADLFLDEPDVWLWTDVETTVERDAYNNPLPPVVSLAQPDFKVLPALPVYLLAALTWLAAIELDTAGAAQLVQSRYGAKLNRHLERLATRPDWNELEQAPQTFPEQIKARITCKPDAQHKYAQNRQCTFSIVCENTMDRKSTVVREAVLDMPPGDNVLCTAPPDLGLMDERQIEEEQGIGALANLEAAIRQVASTGTLRTQFMGQFDTAPISWPAYVYAVNHAGALLWFKQWPSSSPNQPGGWDGPRKVGNGWDTFVSIMPAGGDCFYALLPDGTLRWYRHDAFDTGGPQWTGPQAVGFGWDAFSAIIPGSDGVLYAVQPDGALLWYRHDGFRSGGGVETWRGPAHVGSGWNQFRTIFSAGDGILYAVQPNGALLWYRHKGFVDGSATWDGPTEVAEAGWQGFSHLLCVGDGVIYAVQPDGTMLWYKHESWKTGLGDAPVVQIGGMTIPTAMGPVALWQGPVVIGSGWRGFRHLFAYLPRTPDGIR